MTYGKTIKAMITLVSGVKVSVRFENTNGQSFTVDEVEQLLRLLIEGKVDHRQLTSFYTAEPALGQMPFAIKLDQIAFVELKV